MNKHADLARIRTIQDGRFLEDGGHYKERQDGEFELILTKDQKVKIIKDRIKEIKSNLSNSDSGNYSKKISASKLFWQNELEDLYDLLNYYQHSSGYELFDELYNMHFSSNITLEQGLGITKSRQENISELISRLDEAIHKAEKIGCDVAKLTLDEVEMLPALYEEVKFNPYKRLIYLKDDILRYFSEYDDLTAEERRILKFLQSNSNLEYEQIKNSLQTRNPGLVVNNYLRKIWEKIREEEGDVFDYYADISDNNLIRQLIKVGREGGLDENEDVNENKEVQEKEKAKELIEKLEKVVTIARLTERILFNESGNVSSTESVSLIARIFQNVLEQWTTFSKQGQFQKIIDYKELEVLENLFRKFLKVVYNLSNTERYNLYYAFLSEQADKPLEKDEIKKRWQILGEFTLRNPADFLVYNFLVYNKEQLSEEGRAVKMQEEINQNIPEANFNFDNMTYEELEDLSTIATSINGDIALTINIIVKKILPLVKINNSSYSAKIKKQFKEIKKRQKAVNDTLLRLEDRIKKVFGPYEKFLSDYFEQEDDFNLLLLSVALDRFKNESTLKQVMRNIDKILKLNRKLQGFKVDDKSYPLGIHNDEYTLVRLRKIKQRLNGASPENGIKDTLFADYLIRRYLKVLIVQNSKDWEIIASVINGK